MMNPSDLWRRAMWHLHDMCINGVDRRITFARLRKLGLSARDAAEAIRDCEKEG